MGIANDEPPHCEVPEGLEGLGEVGIKLLGEQNWQGLIVHCQQWTKAEPGNFLAWYLLGHAYQSMTCFQEAIQRITLFQEAIKAYRVAVNLFPGYYSAWESLILAYNALGERDAALEAVRELRKYEPKKADEYLNMLIAERKPRTER